MAARQYGIPKSDVCVTFSEDSQMTGGYLAVKASLAQGEPPTGILAFNDFLAFGAMQAVEEAGYEVTEIRDV